VIAPPSCPICSQLVPAEGAAKSRTFPFCSERCRQVDLLRWSKGEYCIVEPLDPQRVEEEPLNPDESV
jgi:endogenous inhibitor of DNA gyrase (YacG/DUF329 family)